MGPKTSIPAPRQAGVGRRFVIRPGALGGAKWLGTQGLAFDGRPEPRRSAEAREADLLDKSGPLRQSTGAMRASASPAHRGAIFDPSAPSSRPRMGEG